MAFKRKAYKKRSPRKLFKRRTVNRKYSAKKRSKHVTTVARFKRVVPETVIGGIAGANDIIFQAYYINLSQTTAYTNLTNMYDYYKIERVTFKFRLVNDPRSTAVTGGTSTQSLNLWPLLYASIDRDDAGLIPVTQTEMQKFKNTSGCRTYTLFPNKWVTISFKPTVLVPLVNSTNVSSNQGTMIQPPQWLNATYPGVNHYGLKVYVDFTGGASFNALPSTAYVEVQQANYVACKRVTN